jgi:hypothetical protein
VRAILGLNMLALAQRVWKPGAQSGTALDRNRALA